MIISSYDHTIISSHHHKIIWTGTRLAVSKDALYNFVYTKYTKMNQHIYREIQNIYNIPGGGAGRPGPRAARAQGRPGRVSRRLVFCIYFVYSCIYVCFSGWYFLSFAFVTSASYHVSTVFLAACSHLCLLMCVCVCVPSLAFSSLCSLLCVVSLAY